MKREFLWEELTPAVMKGICHTFQTSSRVLALILWNQSAR